METPAPCALAGVILPHSREVDFAIIPIWQVRKLGLWLDPIPVLTKEEFHFSPSSSLQGKSFETENWGGEKKNTEASRGGSRDQGSILGGVSWEQHLCCAFAVNGREERGIFRATVIMGFLEFKR